MGVLERRNIALNEQQRRRVLKSVENKVRSTISTLCSLIVAFALAVPVSSPAWAASLAGTTNEQTPTSQEAQTGQPSEQEPEAPAALDKLVTSIKTSATSFSASSYKSTPATKITVSPAYGRTLTVQRYDTSAKKWVKVSSKKTDASYKSTVAVKLGASWKNHYKSKFRVVAAAVRGKGGTYSAAKKPTAEEFTARGAKRSVSKKISVTYNPVGASSAVVIDAKSKALVYEKNAFKERKIASITKLMTAILLTEKYSLSHKVSITSEAASTPWGIGLVQGDKMSVKNLLYAMMLPSANDAACASGIAVSGTTAKFVKKMTARARKLGCTNTVYKNAHGLDAKGNHSTAYDQALVGAHVMTSKNTSAIRNAARTKSRTISSAAGRSYHLATTDKLLGKNGFVGLKTGTTDDAGECFCGAFTGSDGRLYVSVVLNSKSGKRFDDTKALAKLTNYLH